MSHKEIDRRTLFKISANLCGTNMKELGRKWGYNPQVPAQVASGRSQSAAVDHKIDVIIQQGEQKMQEHLNHKNNR